MADKKTKHSLFRSGYMDYSLLFVVIFLLCFGLIMLYSTSSYGAQLRGFESTFYLKKQMFATTLGIVAMLIASKFNYYYLKKIWILIYVFALGSLLAIFTPLGVEYNGAKRWLEFSFISIQPAEIAKIALIIVLAYIVEKTIKNINTLGVFTLMMIITAPFGLMILIITNDLSSALIVVMIAAIVYFVSSKRYLIFVIAGFVAGILGYLFLSQEGFRKDRILVYLDPEKYATEGGLQVIQGLYAIGSGGMFGKGLGNSVQKIKSIPEAQNDMIFTILCEELGLFGGMLVLGLFAFLLWRLYNIAKHADDLFGSLIVVGIMAHISLQVILNVAVVTNTIPNTGITLPFISYGGTSILFLLAEIGLALSVSRSDEQL